MRHGSRLHDGPRSRHVIGHALHGRHRDRRLTAEGENQNGRMAGARRAAARLDGTTSPAGRSAARPVRPPLARVSCAGPPRCRRPAVPRSACSIWTLGTPRRRTIRCIPTTLGHLALTGGRPASAEPVLIIVAPPGDNRLDRAGQPAAARPKEVEPLPAERRGGEANMVDAAVECPE